MFKLSDRTQKDISLFLSILGIVIGFAILITGYIACLVYAPIWVSGIVLVLVMATVAFVVARDYS